MSHSPLAVARVRLGSNFLGLVSAITANFYLKRFLLLVTSLFKTGFVNMEGIVICDRVENTRYFQPGLLGLHNLPSKIPRRRRLLKGFHPTVLT